MAVDLYKYGITDNPWNKLSISELKTAEDDFRARVKGQDYAITKTLDIIGRDAINIENMTYSLECTYSSDGSVLGRELCNDVYKNKVKT